MQGTTGLIEVIFEPVDRPLQRVALLSIPIPIPDLIGFAS
jgi:hypothetical protein